MVLEQARDQTTSNGPSAVELLIISSSHLDLLPLLSFFPSSLRLVINTIQAPISAVALGRPSHEEDVKLKLLAL